MHRAALALARDHGVDAVTVEAICLEAGVSVRTFFNYFPYREAAFAIPPPPLPPDAVAAFLDGKGTLLDDLTELLAEQVAEASRDRWIGAVLREIRRAHPKIDALLVQQLHVFDGELAGLIARRSGFSVADQGSRMVAAGVLAALRVVLDDLLEVDVPDRRAAVRHGLGQLKSLLDPVSRRTDQKKLD